MINRQALLADLQKFLQRIEADLLERSESTEVPQVPAALLAEYEKAAKAERTAQNYEDWRTDTITQAAAAWVLSCVFVRFLEDNSLIDAPKFAGPGDRLARARDEHELYFRSHPQHTDREYLLSIFGELAKLPGTHDVFGEHNVINDLPNWLSGDAAGELLNFFQKINASTGDLVHDFTDPNWDTRFLGDLYQDLSEAARKKFALLQTPDFVEEFILDRTLDPALDEFGLVPRPSTFNEQSTPFFKMIDPACGSGHFLLGSFGRILDRWFKQEPGINVRELVQRTLNSIHGVDVNPYAIAIARFRLLLAALKACQITRLSDSPGFIFHLACGDSLYHGRQTQMELEGIETDESHYFKAEDQVELKRILREGTFHAVLANPPYVTPKDEAANRVYRELYSSCHKSYSLSVPFMQRIFNLGISDAKSGAVGFIGQITANSFMKAEFGKKIVEQFLPKTELSFVIDCSGACIPGHNTPTVILFGRSRLPSNGLVRTVMGIQGDPETPDVPREGPVWNAIMNQVDHPNTTSAFVNVQDLDRATFYRHPWTIGGGGVSELFSRIEDGGSKTLQDLVWEIGRTTHTGEDSAYAIPAATAKRMDIINNSVPLIDGDVVRDFVLSPYECLVFPYELTDGSSISFEKLPICLQHHFWRLKLVLETRTDFGQTIVQRGLQWFEHSMFFPSRYKNKKSIAYAFVATHNHFVYSEGNSLFNRPAPAIKLRADATQRDYHDLIGMLNSSVACFWIKQVTQIKTQTTGMDSESWRLRRQLNSTKLLELPLPQELPGNFGEALNSLASILAECTPAYTLSRAWSSSLKSLLVISRTKFESIREKMIRVQEDLDWECYRRFELHDEEPISIDESFGLRLGERAFEIVMARKLAKGEITTTWFERHGSTPIAEIPEHWPPDYKSLVCRRIDLIEADIDLALLEQPDYKRRWNTELWEVQLECALREWLLLRIENYFDFDARMTDEADASNRRVPLGEIALYSIAQLADAARRDPQFMEVGELYRDDPAFDVQALIEELVLAESVPHLPILRYKDSGLRKRAEWEKTWDLQRREDAMSGQLSVISAQLKAEKDEKKNPALQAEFDRLTTENRQLTTSISVPPKYTSADFISTGGARYWSLRGKLDVPKERWISFPHCEGPDGTLVICWAGYDHLQQAQAISAYYIRVQTEFGGSDDPRLIPLLASLIELPPWLAQWHNEPNANFDGLRMGDYFEGFVNEEARNLGKTLAEIKAWVPPVRTATRSRKKTK